MGKQKTKKAVVKRFRKTKRGKVLFAHAGKSHLNSHKSRKRKRNLRRTGKASPGFEKRLSVLMP
ncbi:MAG: 50S ribosomal protein L35 [bacterium]